MQEFNEEEYNKSKKKKPVVTKRFLKQKKMACGDCRFYETDTFMCGRTWPGVIGQLTARGARTDHTNKTYCGMRGQGFQPIVAGMEDADVVAEETRKKPGPKPKLKGPGQGA